MKGALAATAALQLAPAHAEQSKAMEQMAALEVVGLAQVEVVVAPAGLVRHTQPALLARQILLERRLWRLARHIAKRLADDQLFVDQAHRHLAAEAEDRLRGLVQLRQTGQRAAA